MGTGCHSDVKWPHKVTWFLEARDMDWHYSGVCTIKGGTTTELDLMKSDPYRFGRYDLSI